MQFSRKCKKTIRSSLHVRLICVLSRKPQHKKRRNNSKVLFFCTSDVHFPNKMPQFQLPNRRRIKGEGRAFRDQSQILRCQVRQVSFSGLKKRKAGKIEAFTRFLGITPGPLSEFKLLQTSGVKQFFQGPRHRLWSRPRSRPRVKPSPGPGPGRSYLLSLRPRPRLCLSSVSGSREVFLENAFKVAHAIVSGHLPVTIFTCDRKQKCKHFSMVISHANFTCSRKRKFVVCNFDLIAEPIRRPYLIT